MKGNYGGRGADVWYTGHHDGAFNTEPLMASYLGIAEGQIPREHYFGTYRTFPTTLRLAWTETKPVGAWKEYLGLRVFEGALPSDDDMRRYVAPGALEKKLRPLMKMEEFAAGPRVAP